VKSPPAPANDLQRATDIAEQMVRHLREMSDHAWPLAYDKQGVAKSLSWAAASKPAPLCEAMPRARRIDKERARPGGRAMSGP